MEKKQDKYLKVEIIGRLEVAEIITKKLYFEGSNYNGKKARQILKG